MKDENTEKPVLKRSKPIDIPKKHELKVDTSYCEHTPPQVRVDKIKLKKMVDILEKDRHLKKGISF